MSLEFAIVIPAYNEQSNIAAVLESLKTIDSSVILVDDCSCDNTIEAASDFDCTILKNKSNLGYEASINLGLSYAVESGYKYVATFDADGELSLIDLKHFFREIKQKDFDLVVGIRKTKNRFSEIIFSIWSNYRFGIKDPLCGLKVFKCASLKSFLPISSEGLIGTGLVMRFSDQKKDILQIVIHPKKRKGKSKFGSGLKGEFLVFKSLVKAMVIFKTKIFYERKRNSS